MTGTFDQLRNGILNILRLDVPTAPEVPRPNLEQIAAEEVHQLDAGINGKGLQHLDVFDGQVRGTHIIFYTSSLLYYLHQVGDTPEAREVFKRMLEEAFKSGSQYTKMYSILNKYLDTFVSTRLDGDISRRAYNEMIFGHMVDAQPIKLYAGGGPFFMPNPDTPNIVVKLRI